MGNPKGSPWRSTPRAARRRKPLSVTLSNEERAALEAYATARGLTLSQAVAELIRIGAT